MNDWQIVRKVAEEMLNTSMHDIDARRIHDWAVRLGDLAVSKTETTTQGNAAKMREAVVKCYQLAYGWEFNEREGTAGVTEPDAAETLLDIQSITTAALSAPLRNCDVIDCNWLPDEFYRSIYGRLPVSPEELDEFMEFSWLGFVKWIEAPYKEGGNDGSK